MVIDESVVHRQAGGPDIMAAQLDHLIEVTDAPNVDLRVLPFDSGTFPFGSFTRAGIVQADQPYMACVQDTGACTTSNGTEVWSSTSDFSSICSEVALSPSESVDLIATVVKELDHDRRPARLAQIDVQHVGRSMRRAGPARRRSVLVRNSNHPDAGTLALTTTETAAWLAGCQAGEMDDLTS